MQHICTNRDGVRCCRPPSYRAIRLPVARAQGQRHLGYISVSCGMIVPLCISWPCTCVRNVHAYLLPVKYRPTTAAPTNTPPCKKTLTYRYIPSSYHMISLHATIVSFSMMHTYRKKQNQTHTRAIRQQSINHPNKKNSDNTTRAAVSQSHSHRRLVLACLPRQSARQNIFQPDRDRA